MSCLTTIIETSAKTTESERRYIEKALYEIFRKYYDSLAPGGILFIGSTEQIINYKEMGYVRKNSFYYERPM